MSYASRQFHQVVCLGMAFATLAVAAHQNLPLKPMHHVAALPKMSGPLGLGDERLIADLELQRHLKAHPLKHKAGQPFHGGADAFMWALAEK